MQIYIVGYPWCPHFQRVCQTLEKWGANPIFVNAPEPNRPLLHSIVRGVIGQRPQIGTPADTSPQIIALMDHTAVCIPGEDALRRIGVERLGEVLHRRVHAWFSQHVLPDIDSSGLV